MKGDWVSYSNKGERIVSSFWDWCCMYKLIADYQDELGISEDEAYEKFWNDIREYDPEDFELCLDGKTLEDALGYGALDELRADYLYGLNIDCRQVVE